ncbi:ADP-ribosylglycohydrolase family protein [Bacteroides ovatus]|nr:ADP-ribosylglycohydrolase family protein [Bacteroides ovatus]
MYHRAFCSQRTNYQPVKTLKLSDKELLDKIKGGWAGQTIGVVFGAPTEFKFTGTYIQDYQPIPWAEGYVKYWWEKKPGLFDDIYNDCTFVEAFDELVLWIVHKKNLPKDLHSLIII